MKTVLATLSLTVLAGGALWMIASRTGGDSPGPPAHERSPAAPEGARPGRSEGERPAGSWWQVSGRPAAEDAEAIEDLAALGYLAGYRKAPDLSGVTAYDPERAQPGYNLVVSGHAPHAALMDPRGRVLHEWSIEPPAEYPVPPDRRFWRRVHLLPGGELLAIFDPFGIVKLDRDSNLLWATDTSNHIHHDLFVAGDGRIHTLGKRYRKLPRLHPELNFGQDMVVVLDAEGNTLSRFSILDAFERSPYLSEIEESIRRTTVHAKGPGWEDFHANTIEVLDGSDADLSPIFKAGNVVSCSPAHNNVFIVDPDEGRVVWNWIGPWRRIHEPQILPGGRLLLFHNNGHQEGVVSQALEYDLLSRELVWSYDGRADDPRTRFFSGTSSTVERLPNGNTLIVVTESGRAIEVTPDGTVVWEFFNPERAGDDGELIASLFQLQRVPREMVDPWLGGTVARTAGGR